MTKLDVVFVHGWGLNSAVWKPYVSVFSDAFNVNLHCIDMPGYGESSLQQTPDGLLELTKICLEQAPDKALWVGWSLGGMVAMQAALLDKRKRSARVLGLQLINTTPCFVQKPDWSCGVELGVFEQFNSQLASNYKAALKSFLLLQAGRNKGARTLVKKVSALLMQYPSPSARTLQQGMFCLKRSDLRESLSMISVPTQIISGRLDRITNPECSDYLAEKIQNALHVQLNTGHAPFLTDTDDMLNATQAFVNQYFFGCSA